MQDFDDEIPRMSVVDFAHQVIRMDDEMHRLREENAELREYRQRYMDELTNGIQHNHHMLGGLLKIAMVPGVIDTIRQHHSEEEQA